MSDLTVVIGAGPAGMMAAGTAAKNGNRVILLEKNKQLGKKLFISGKGRCNITNTADIQGLIENIPGNGHFLYSAFYTFSNEDLIEFFKKLGLNTKVERGNRVFPISDKSSDVIKALEKFLKESNVDIRFDSEVSDISKINEGFEIKLSNGLKIKAKNVIISTGGASYRATGSTGDGYRFAEKLGHKIVNIKPSLVPLISSENWISELQGLSLKNVSVKLFKNNKKIFDDFGEMLFTHYGVSGPIILSSSRHLIDVNFDREEIKLTIDLKPALNEDQLDKRIQRDFEAASRKQFKNSLDELLPQKLIPIVIKLSCINPEKPVNQIIREERAYLVKLLKQFKVKISGTRPLNEGIVTCGGVSTDEINPSTMESKLVDGLYFAGEVIDVDGYTGGFNLTIAFSTGFVAGAAAARSQKSSNTLY